ncbi:hypothetical protein NEIELOOT_02981 [Neisseria elongata subsp. glycolytica ATCC 29315]|uniref:Uncharacterized protein n=1 Tax=Neisseria elongata subsp. glycolytica ATCC 29315 TaxID=546263 RepID=D4DV65_NEIEG|nr:hypothetical protein NEIELOOT_02981 [Neisseria elongata subsp. glycolytica ATCC 29315]
MTTFQTAYFSGKRSGRLKAKISLGRQIPTALNRTRSISAESNRRKPFDKACLGIYYFLYMVFIICIYF